MVQDLSTKSLIKTLPLEREFKEKLLSKYDSLTLELKVDIDELVWDVYDAIYQMKLQENMELALLDEKTDKLDPGFYSSIRKKTDEQMREEELKSIDNFDLASTRGKLENVLKSTGTE